MIGTPWNANPSSAPCVFPFRYEDVLHYGCTHPVDHALSAAICATSTDDDYNAEEVAACEERCHVQSKDHCIE